MNNFNTNIIKVNQYIRDNRDSFNYFIGQKIKEVRKVKNIQYTEFEERSLMGINQISQIENGKNGISLNKFVIICNALEVNPNDFLEELLFAPKINEDILYYCLQEDKSISKNILNFIVRKR